MAKQTKLMTESEIKALVSFQELTPKMQRLVLTYVSNGRNRVAAVLSVYNFKTPESARVGSYAYFQNVKIVRCLNEIFHVSPRDQFMAELDAAFRNPNLSMAQVAVLCAKGKTLGVLPENYEVGVG